MTLKTISSITRYNNAFPEALMPSNMRELESMRRFNAAGIGLEDDVTGSGGLLAIDFLPGGAPSAAVPQALLRPRRAVSASFWPGPARPAAVRHLPPTGWGPITLL